MSTDIQLSLWVPDIYCDLNVLHIVEHFSLYRPNKVLLYFTKDIIASSICGWFIFRVGLGSPLAQTNDTTDWRIEFPILHSEYLSMVQPRGARIRRTGTNVATKSQKYSSSRSKVSQCRREAPTLKIWILSVIFVAVNPFTEMKLPLQLLTSVWWSRLQFAYNSTNELELCRDEQHTLKARWWAYEMLFLWNLQNTTSERKGYPTWLSHFSERHCF